MIKANIFEFSLPYSDKGDRRVRVFVPEHEDGETLPVIYMTDGQNLFDVETSSYGCWYTREAVAEERAENGKAAIIVGIHNDVSPIQRTVELTPGCIGAPAYPREMPKEMRAKLKPEGEVFEDFLLNTVMPAVEERFPVKKGRSNTAFCGSSMGGLFAFYIAMSHPDVFGFSGVLSPAFVVFDPNDVAAWIKEHASGELPFIYLYSGAADELEKTICEVTESSYDILKDLFPKSLLKKVIMPEQPHHEKAWEPIFRDFLHIFLS